MKVFIRRALGIAAFAAAGLFAASSAHAQCTNTCSTSFDGECDDGGPNSLYSICDLGTDCNDCGPRGGGATTNTGGTLCTNTCMTSNDNECDDGGPNSLYSICDLGTDCNDCGPRSAGASSGGGGGGGLCTNTCSTSFDNECDDGGPNSLYSICPLGTDCADCGPRNAGSTGSTGGGGGGGGGTQTGAQWWQDPTFGAINLVSGFTPDPWPHSITAGGGHNPQNVSQLGYSDSVDGTRCVGFVARSPDFRFNYTQGAFPFLRFYVQTTNGADAMLLINDPYGNWRCNDDSHGTLMPSIDFRNPASGQYDVWIGTYDGSSYNPGNLYITELEGNHP